MNPRSYVERGLFSRGTRPGWARDHSTMCSVRRHTVHPPSRDTQSRGAWSCHSESDDYWVIEQPRVDNVRVGIDQDDVVVAPVLVAISLGLVTKLFSTAALARLNRIRLSAFGHVGFQKSPGFVVVRNGVRYWPG